MNTLTINAANKQCWHDKATTSTSDTTAQTLRHCPDCGLMETTYATPVAEQGDAKDARYLTVNEILQALVDELNAGVKHTPQEIIQRKFCEVNGITLNAILAKGDGK